MGIAKVNKKAGKVGSAISFSISSMINWKETQEHCDYWVYQPDAKQSKIYVTPSVSASF